MFPILFVLLFYEFHLKKALLTYDHVTLYYAQWRHKFTVAVKVLSFRDVLPHHLFLWPSSPVSIIVFRFKRVIMKLQAHRTSHSICQLVSQRDRRSGIEPYIYLCNLKLRVALLLLWAYVTDHQACEKFV